MHDAQYFRELLVSNKANGFRDLIATIDLSTYRRLPWEQNIPFFLLRFIVPETNEGLVADPRTLIRDVTSRAEEQGWKCLAGAEFEVSRWPISKTDGIVLPVQRDSAVRR